MKSILLDLTQSQINFDIEEDCEIYAWFIGKDEEEIQSRVNLIFTKPDIKARINIKAALYDQSIFNLDCKVIVPKGMKNVDGYLKINVLNLSESAKTNVTPSLVIMENDVKCSHALTIGKPDKDQLIYLQSRGLTEDQSKELIVQGFIKK